MIITTASLRAMFKGFQVLFKNGMTMAEPWASKVARTVPSTGEEETYTWLTAIPSLRHWVGPRVIENLRTRGFTIKNKPFEGTLGVEREKIEDDKFGIYGDYASLLGQQAAKHPDNCIAPIFLFGEQALYGDPLIGPVSLVVYDGQPLFSDVHPVDQDDPNSPVQSNYYPSGMALTPDNYELVRANMRSLVDVNGRKLGIKPDTLIVSPQKESTGKRIVEADTIARGNSQEDNVNQGTAEVLVLEELSDDPNAWFLAMLKNPVMRPIMYQERQKPRFQALMNGSEYAFINNQYLAGVDCRGNAAPAVWQSIAKCKP
jgi:phage major head subunit gpT-like protein